MQSFPRPQIRQNQNTYQSSDSILAFPDMNKPFILTCDASKSAIGYILSQIGDDNKEHVISYNGRSLRPGGIQTRIQKYGCRLLIQETIQTRTRGAGTESKAVRRQTSQTLGK